ncbi:MAG: purine-binding chemotaxis protein CheW [Nitrospirae bacterium]|nr:purine-binding chemotaxis protein CheW [Nitrospirota bacterium]
MTTTAMETTAPTHPADAHPHEYLTFTLDSEEYGVPILSVQEIIGYQKPTPIPNAPKWVSGVVNIRGVVIPVVDIRSLLGMAAKDCGVTSVIIVTRVDGRTIGSVVDHVNDVLAFTPDQMQSTPEVADGVRTDSITGLGKLDQRLVMLLDMRQVLQGSHKTLDALPVG